MAKSRLVIVMLIWGSIGVFSRNIVLSPILLAFFRAVIALPVLGMFMIADKRVRKVTLRKLKPYIVSGVLLGIGWLTLFYGFQKTTIASAIIVYNMSPVYVLLLVPMYFKEKMNKRSLLTVITAIVGLLMIVGTSLNGVNLSGVLLSGISGLCYAFIVIINRSIIDKYDDIFATFIQVIFGVLILIPFVLLEGNIGTVMWLDNTGLFLLIILGVVHTGVAYTLYFGTYTFLDAYQISIYGYLEPVFSICFGYVLLNESLSFFQFIGGGLILGSTLCYEYVNHMEKRRINPFDPELDFK